MTIGINKLIRSAFIHPIRKSVFKFNGSLNRYKEVVWLIGDGRSGTTWVSNLINYQKNYREIFEPFHPKIFNDLNFSLPHLYIRPEEKNDVILKMSSDIFNGRFYDERVSRGNRRLLYGGLLVKDIFANLFSYWVSLRFSQIKIILLLRNPFAVALSKKKMSDAFWVKDPMVLFRQQDLVEDHLFFFEDLIHTICETEDFFLKQILIWSIINYVPLQQFREHNLHVVFYENMYRNPQKESSKLIQHIKSMPETEKVNIPSKLINTPSRMSGKEGDLISGQSPINNWKNELSVKQIDTGFHILKSFGFGELYCDGFVPESGKFHLAEN